MTDFLSHLNAIVSPLGTYSYDFETGINRKHGAFKTLANQPYCDQFEIASCSIAFYIHMLSGFGHFAARNKHLRLRASTLGLQYLDKDLFEKNQSSGSVGNQSLLLKVKESDGIVFSGVDPLAPKLGFPFVSHWYCHLSAFSMLRNLSAAKLSFDDQLMKACFTSFLLAEDEFSKSADADEMKAVNKVRAIFDEVTVVRYDGERKTEITTDSLIECYMALSEIVILRIKSPNQVHELTKIFSEHESFSVVQFALFSMGIEQTPHNMAMMAPAILYCIELSLMFPSPGSISDLDETINFRAFYPPSRYLLALEKIDDLGWPSPLEGTAEDFRKNVKDLLGSVEFPVVSFRSLHVKNEKSEKIRRFLVRSENEAQPEFFPWIDWYEAFSNELKEAIDPVCTSMTEFCLFHVPRLGEKNARVLSSISPPITIDDLEIVFAGSILQGFDHLTTFMFRSYFFEIVNTYWHNSWLGETGSIKVFPFEISDRALYGRWLDVPRQTIESHIRGSLLP